MKLAFVVLSATIVFTTSHAAFANGDVDVPDAAAFVNEWHGLGPDHQDDQDGTASDRHGFNNATAGKSGKNPTDNPNDAGQNDDD